MNLPAFMNYFDRQARRRLTFGAVASVVAAAGLGYLAYDLQSQLAAIQAEFAVTPDIDPSQVNTQDRPSKEVGQLMLDLTAKYDGIRKQIETYIPREGGKPGPISINDIVLKFPRNVEVERSERFLDSALKFNEIPPPPPGAFIDTRAPTKPSFPFQGVAYTFSLRTPWNSLVRFLSGLDSLKAYYAIRNIHVYPLPALQSGEGTTLDPKVAVQIDIFTIYLPKVEE